jgi:hypothetical protein
MPQPPLRVATLVIVDADGDVCGQLPAFSVATPWWQDMAPVIDACRERFGIAPTVLRLLFTERGTYPGGGVSYLAEARRDDLDVIASRLQPWTGTLDEQPLRMSWARVGGPAADLAWADRALTAAGRHRTGDAVQMRTWNLSSVWRLPTTAGLAWLKVVPPFFAHEGAVLGALAGGPVPLLLGREGPRVLMVDIAGDDRYDATGPELLRMVDGLVAIQRTWAGRVEELAALGLPDWRPPFLSAAIADVVARTADQLTADARATLARLVDGLPNRLAAVDECGLPETLVHGDFAPGNVRGDGDGTPMTLLDWGDSTIGHPLLDLPAFLDRTPRSERPAIRTHWEAAWRAAVPGADPARAARLLAPVAAARQAVVYRRFLDGIEPAERAYHAGDPADWLRRTVVILDEER